MAKFAGKIASILNRMDEPISAFASGEEFQLIRSLQATHTRLIAGRPVEVSSSIVFHGDRDTTVSPRKGDDVVEQSVQGAALRSQVQTGQVPGGRGQ